MSNLSFGARAKVAFDAGEVVRVTSPGVATVVMDYGGPEGTTNITAGTQDFGPYSVPARITVTATSGTTSYEVLSDEVVLSRAEYEAVLDLIGGGGGGGITTGAVYSIPNGATYVLEAPAPTASVVAEDIAVLRAAGATGFYGQTGHVVDGVLPPMPQGVGQELVLRRTTTDSGSTWHLRGILPGESLGSYAWASLPSASGLTGVTATLTNFGGCQVRSDGTRWRPLNGIATIYKAQGRLGAALVTLAGSAGAQKFTLGSDLSLPIGMLYPGAEVRISAKFRRIANAGAPAAVVVSATLGTANANTDPIAVSTSVAATVNQDYVMEGAAGIESATAFLASASMGYNNTNNAILADRTSGFDTAAINYVNFAVSAAYASGDQFALLGYQIDWVG